MAQSIHDPFRLMPPPAPGFAGVYRGAELVVWVNAQTGEAMGLAPGSVPENLVRSFHEDADVSDTVAQCYFIGGEDGPVKIGYSVSPGGRLRDIQTHSPVKLSILALAKGGATREFAYHFQFRRHRLHGEWFERRPEIEAEITRLNEGK